MTELQNYRGNKGILGLYQFIINRIPPCDTFYEAFAGSAAITRKLLSSAVTVEAGCMVLTVLNDCNTGTTDKLRCMILQLQQSVTAMAPTDGSSFKLRTPQIQIKNLPAVQLLSTVSTGNSCPFVYCDPPYILSSRGSTRRIYEYEMTDDDHIQFLSTAAAASFNCMISHYECDLYNNMLPGWNKEKFLVSYHGQVKEECIYYNYPKPEKLLTYSYVGSDCWDRQRVTRKINRLVKKLTALPPLERNAVLSRVNNSLTFKSN